MGGNVFVNGGRWMGGWGMGKKEYPLAGIVDITIGESCTTSDNVGSANSVLVILAAGESNTALQVHEIVLQSGWTIHGRTLGHVAIERLLVLGIHPAEVVVSDHVASSVAFNDPASIFIAVLIAIHIIARELDLCGVVDKQYTIGDASTKRALVDGDVGTVPHKNGLGGLLKRAIPYGGGESANNPEIVVITVMQMKIVE